MAANPRYLWRDDVPRAAVQRLLRRSHAMVLSSRSEGGANVFPKPSSRRAHPGLAHGRQCRSAGSDYPGYFPVGDTKALARLLQRIESDPRFVATLRRAIARRAPLFRPEPRDRGVAAAARGIGRRDPDREVQWRATQFGGGVEVLAQVLSRWAALLAPARPGEGGDPVRIPRCQVFPLGFRFARE